MDCAVLSHYAQEDRVAFFRLGLRRLEFLCRRDDLTVDLLDEVSFSQALLLGHTARVHLAHQHAFLVLDLELVGELGREVLHVEPELDLRLRRGRGGGPRDDGFFLSLAPGDGERAAVPLPDDLPFHLCAPGPARPPTGQSGGGLPPAPPSPPADVAPP